jgi:ATP adenylyltransferase
MAYIEGTDKVKQQGCVFCLPPDHLGPMAERLVLYSDDLTIVIMNLYPYNNGHLLVAPRRHVNSLSLTTESERLALMNLTVRATEALEKAQKAQGFNLGINQGTVAGAGITDHLHLHVTPRYLGDVNFMTVLSETRVIPEHIEATYQRLLGFFQ